LPNPGNTDHGHGTDVYGGGKLASTAEAGEEAANASPTPTIAIAK
jgi:hypothetical protein